MGEGTLETALGVAALGVGAFDASLEDALEGALEVWTAASMTAGVGSLGEPDGVAEGQSVSR